MSETTEFDIADREAGVTGELVTTPPKNANGAVQPVNAVEYRAQLISRYHQGAKGLVDKLRTSGHNDAEALLLSLINEVIQETDHLLGNELVATENGELRDASIISFKRAEVLEKAIKAVQSKHQLEREQGLDLDSPAMMVVFRYFMSKVKTALVKANAPDDMSDLFFRTLSDAMADWKRDLRVQFGELKGAKP
jgi:isopropylmalate/homocitrate/citramalate synthase